MVKNVMVLLHFLYWQYALENCLLLCLNMYYKFLECSFCYVLTVFQSLLFSKAVSIIFGPSCSGTELGRSERSVPEQTEPVGG